MLWSVCFRYLDITSGNYHFRSHAVKAETKEEALEKFNKVAKERSGYPCYWEQATIDDVTKLDIIE